jgi:hypothetical protein
MKEKSSAISLFISIASGSLTLLRVKLRYEILKEGYDIELLNILDRCIDTTLKESGIIFKQVLNKTKEPSIIKVKTKE